jgi:hypothetical protein
MAHAEVFRCAVLGWATTRAGSSPQRPGPDAPVEDDQIAGWRGALEGRTGIGAGLRSLSRSCSRIQALIVRSTSRDWSLLMLGMFAHDKPIRLGRLSQIFECPLYNRHVRRARGTEGALLCACPVQLVHERASPACYLVSSRAHLRNRTILGI